MTCILLWRTDIDKKNKLKWLDRLIEFFTGKPYSHVALYVDGFTYQQGIFIEKEKVINGSKKSHGIDFDADEIWCFLSPISDLKERMIKDQLQLFIEKKEPYNILKLLSFPAIYPIRKFLESIKAVPFSDDLYGEVCSTFVDNILTLSGIDLFPDRLSDTTVPGDFAESKYLFLKEKI